MVDLGIVITGVIGILTSVISSWTTWFFARKKYNSEVDNNLIENMTKSLSFYQNLSNDNKKRLDDALQRSSRLEEEVNELRRQVFSLTASICTDLTCQLRKGAYDNIIKKQTNENTDRQEV